MDLYKMRPPQWSRSEEVAAPWQASLEYCVDPTRRILVMDLKVCKRVNIASLVESLAATLSYCGINNSGRCNDRCMGS